MFLQLFLLDGNLIFAQPAKATKNNFWPEVTKRENILYLTFTGNVGFSKN